MGFPQSPSAFGSGIGGPGLMQQPILPEIPKEALWFILNLKMRGESLKSTRLQNIWDKRVGIVSAWPMIMFKHVKFSTMVKISIVSFLQKEQ